MFMNTSQQSAFESSVARRSIKGTFIPQVYRNDRDDHPVELDPVPFEATEQVLMLDLVKIQELIDERLDPGDVDDLVPSAVRDDHDGPFRVDDLALSVAQFFMVSEGSEVDEAILEVARAAHRIGELKTYHVRVQRIQTSTVWIEVQGRCEADARYNALDKAGDYDFLNEGTQSTPEYVTDDVQEVMSQDEAMATPRPRG